MRTLVINKQTPASNDLLPDTQCLRKRSFHELDDINDLINNMNGLSHEPQDKAYLNISDSELDDDDITHPADIFSYINLQPQSHLNLIDEEIDMFDEDIDDECDSPNLSRSTSPSAMSETDGENSLMTSLTRSTTVSTNNSSSVNTKMQSISSLHHHNLNSYPFKFYDLPNYASVNDLSSFSMKNIDPHDPNLMSIIQEDNYNSVNDFLEEKLIDNDVSYYVNQQN